MVTSGFLGHILKYVREILASASKCGLLQLELNSTQKFENEYYLFLIYASSYLPFEFECLRNMFSM